MRLPAYDANTFVCLSTSLQQSSRYCGDHMHYRYKLESLLHGGETSVFSSADGGQKVQGYRQPGLHE